MSGADGIASAPDRIISLFLRANFLINYVLNASKALKFATTTLCHKRCARRWGLVEAHLSAIAVAVGGVVRCHHQFILACDELIGCILVHLLGEGAQASGIVVGAEFQQCHFLTCRQSQRQISHA